MICFVKPVLWTATRGPQFLHISYSTPPRVFQWGEKRFSGSFPAAAGMV